MNFEILHGHNIMYRLWTNTGQPGSPAICGHFHFRWNYIPEHKVAPGCGAGFSYLFCPDPDAHNFDWIRLYFQYQHIFQYSILFKWRPLRYIMVSSFWTGYTGHDPCLEKQLWNLVEPNLGTSWPKIREKIVSFSGSASPGFRARGKFLIFYFVAGGSTKSTVSFQEFIFMPPSVVLDGNSDLAAHI